MITALVLLAALSANGAGAPPPQEPASSLEQAVARVQHDTGGTILSVDMQHRGKRAEYRIKVLTPDGHVRVVAVPAEVPAASGSIDSTKSPAADGAGSKEKH
jgi:uncharacterized membrane protein YkoI